MQFPIDLEQYDRREQLKKSGLGKVKHKFCSGNCCLLDTYASVRMISYICMQVIMFLSKSDEETTSNRKLAKELVDKWVINLYTSNMQSFFLSIYPFTWIIYCIKQCFFKYWSNTSFDNLSDWWVPVFLDVYRPIPVSVKNNKKMNTD